MVILHRKKNEENANNFVGVYLPTRLSSYLSLYCLSTGKTKTTVMRELMENWVKKMRKGLPVSIVVESVAKRAYDIWRTQTTEQKYDDFKTALKKELVKKGLEKYVTDIFNTLDNEKSKDRKRTT